jgi:Na+-transporting methylmalonyl-CoA/oxaloacetate decarboxylase gamma subunit
MNKTILKIFIITSFFTFVISSFLSALELDVELVGLVFLILIPVCTLVVAFLGGFIMEAISTKQNSTSKFHQKETDEEKVAFLIENTPIYGLIIIANAIILFIFIGLVSCLSFTVFFGLAFASPWHKEVRAIVTEWEKKKE